MRQTRSIELATGFFAALGFAAIFFMVTQITDRDLSFGEAGYRLEAEFDNIGSLKQGAPVSMSGVAIGRVESIRYDQETYKARVALRIRPEFNRIPDDSDAAVFTAGLLGGQYIGLQPGGSETFLKDGSRIGMTQSAIVLEELIGKFLFSFASKEAEEKTAPTAAPATESVP
jgi:phospholipid/cholesterol/gamma-HCH transport system substrate-binding protein